MLDSKIKMLCDHFGIIAIDDWSVIRADEVRSVENVGPKTLNVLRLHLANHGVTLQGDRTPAYWQSKLSQVPGIDGETEPIDCPFAILVDVGEQQPWRFAGLVADKRDGGRPYIVHTDRVALGPTHGDYAIDGLQGYCNIERKGLGDFISTILAFDERRDQFERTLTYLSEIDQGVVITEATFDAAISEIADPNSVVNRNARTPAKTRAKMFARRVIALMQDFRVPWLFAETPRRAEQHAFNWMNRAWRTKQDELKQANKRDNVNL